MLASQRIDELYRLGKLSGFDEEARAIKSPCGRMFHVIHLWEEGRFSGIGSPFSAYLCKREQQSTRGGEQGQFQICGAMRKMSGAICTILAQPGESTGA